jgi:hypothetical protein
MAKAGYVEVTKEVEATQIQGQVVITGVNIGFGDMVRLGFKGYFAILIAVLAANIILLPLSLFVLAMFRA